MLKQKLLHLNKAKAFKAKTKIFYTEAKQSKAKVFKAKKNFYTKAKQFAFFVVFLKCIFAFKKRKSGPETSITVLLLSREFTTCSI